MHIGFAYCIGFFSTKLQNCNRIRIISSTTYSTTFLDFFGQIESNGY